MPRFVFERDGAFWWIYENTGEGERRIVCVCVYKRGAIECVRRLNELWAQLEEGREANCI